MNILIINGPNLNLLGKRKPEIYGNETLDDINKWLLECEESSQLNIKFYQSNHEGNIIDSLHDSIDWAKGILINAGAYTHYSYAIRDAIEAIRIPVIEIHLSDISNREDFRKISVIQDVCLATFSGLGKFSYLEGIKYLIKKM